MKSSSPLDADRWGPGGEPGAADDRSNVWRLLMLFLLASLGMLFAASLVGYLNIRSSHPQVRLDLPMGLWISSVFLALGAVAGHAVWLAAGQGRLQGLRARLGLLGATSVGFLAVQTPCLSGLLKTHWERLQADPQQPMALYGLVFSLILVHALHVVGGLVPLGVQIWRVFTGRFDARHVPGLRATVVYWHFLEAVWAVLFGAFLITG